MKGTLFDDNIVEIDPGCLSVGGSWETEGRGARAYDGAAIRFFFQRLKEMERPHFLDIGANSGSFCLLPALIDSSCWAFEPFPPVFELLKSNVRLNGLEGKVRTFPIALSDESRIATLRTPQGFTGLSSLATDAEATGSSTAVKTITLDVLAEREGLPNLSAVKIDVEGGELAVLRGGEHTLRTHMPDIQLEYSKLYRFGHRPSDIVSLLEGWGYEHLILSLEDMYFYSPITRGGLRRLRWRYGPASDLIRRALRRARRVIS